MPLSFQIKELFASAVSAHSEQADDLGCAVKNVGREKSLESRQPKAEV